MALAADNAQYSSAAFSNLSTMNTISDNPPPPNVNCTDQLLDIPHASNPIVKLANTNTGAPTDAKSADSTPPDLVIQQLACDGGVPLTNALDRVCGNRVKRYVAALEGLVELKWMTDIQMIITKTGSKTKAHCLPKRARVDMDIFSNSSDMSASSCSSSGSRKRSYFNESISALLSASKELHPTLDVWADLDQPGKRAMTAVSKRNRRRGSLLKRRKFHEIPEEPKPMAESVVIQTLLNKTKQNYTHVTVTDKNGLEIGSSGLPLGVETYPSGVKIQPVGVDETPAVPVTNRMSDYTPRLAIEDRMLPPSSMAAPPGISLPPMARPMSSPQGVSPSSTSTSLADLKAQAGRLTAPVPSPVGSPVETAREMRKRKEDSEFQEAYLKGIAYAGAAAAAAAYHRYRAQLSPMMRFLPTQGVRGGTIGQQCFNQMPSSPVITSATSPGSICVAANRRIFMKQPTPPVSRTHLIGLGDTAPTMLPAYADYCLNDARFTNRMSVAPVVDDRLTVNSLKPGLQPRLSPTDSLIGRKSTDPGGVLSPPPPPFPAQLAHP